MSELLQNPMTWVAAAGLILLIGNFNLVYGFAKKFIGKGEVELPIKSAVQHFLALGDYCKDRPAAQKCLKELWEHLNPMGGPYPEPKK